jgi:hypothetical protein
MQTLGSEGLTLCSQVLLEMLVVPKLDNKFFSICTTGKFNTVFATAPHSVYSNECTV